MLENLKTISSGEVLIRQGSFGQSAYIIEEGRVEICLEKPDGTRQVVASRGPGTIIGEMALIDDAPRTATVLALEDCKLIEITREDFTRRLQSSDPIMQAVLRVLITRYRDTLARSVIVGENPGYPPPEEVERSFMEATDTIAGLRMENEFKSALNNGQISLNYQPIVSLTTGDILGFEALMRWIHPEKGFISPAVFIPMAERSGLIVEASKWALRESCNALKRIDAVGAPGPQKYMSVNFSSKDLAETSFLDDIRAVFAETGIGPERIQLEITESLLMSQPEHAKVTLEECRRMGLKIAIDDFGTGYSSLSYLHSFPIGTLKIDQSFVRDMLKNSNSLELSKSIIALGKNLNMTITAEGVEGLREAITLTTLGCETAQGYYFAKPLPEKDLLALLAAEPSFAAKLS
jgi:EAL domain-containing protein (putative c-di-GMP-specific phosphodiesterase class I)